MEKVSSFEGNGKNRVAFQRVSFIASRSIIILSRGVPSFILIVGIE